MESEGNGARPRRSVGRRWVMVLLAIAVAGTSAWFWRRRITRILTNLAPYERRAAHIERAALIINRWSGDGKAEQYGLADHAESLGIRTIMLERGDDLVDLANQAIDEGADAIGMAGGDGSLGLVAGVAAERDVPFFCVPVGTRNHFALDLGLDRDDPLAALDAVTDGDELRIDHGTVGDRVFVNNVSLGVYAAAVHQEGYRGEKVKTIAEVVTEAAADPSKVEGIHLTGPDGQRYSRVPMLLISNNPYVMSGPPDFGRRTRLDGGSLGIAAATNFPDPSTVTLVTIADLAGWHEWTDELLVIESDEPEIMTGVDGEALRFPAPLEVRAHGRRLRVLVPSGVRPGYLGRPEQRAAKLLDYGGLSGASDTPTA